MIKQSKYVPAAMLCDKFTAIGECKDGVASVQFSYHDEFGIVVDGTSIDATVDFLEKTYDLFVWVE